MKRTIITLMALVVIMLSVSCMHNCICTVHQEFISAGHTRYEDGVDTVPSKLDCGTMNIDTTYDFNQYTYDSLSQQWVVVDSSVGQIINITICE